MKSVAGKPRKWLELSFMNDKETCPICELAPPEAYNIFSNDSWRVRHSAETDIPGYCILEPHRHILDLSEANPAELHSYGTLLAGVMKAQRTILACRRVYTFSLAEAVPHYHLHIIPIARDFPPAWRGRGIMSYPLEPACESGVVERTSRLIRDYLKGAI